MSADLAVTSSAQGSTSTTGGASYFAGFWVILLIGFFIHWAIDRRRHGHRRGRPVELLFLWVMVFGGVYAILGGLGHISGASHRLAVNIGYTPSMFQWEVGWADIAIGVLGVGCAWRAMRGQWATAAVVALAFSYGGDAIGHIMTWNVHNNTAPDNVWAIPSDILQPALAIILLVLYRRFSPRPVPGIPGPRVGDQQAGPDAREAQDARSEQGEAQRSYQPGADGRR
jgi:hypothetical protein